MESNRGHKFWNFVDNLEGDKVVWMIVLMLMLASIVCIFSSTSLLAIQQKSSRMSIAGEQLVIALLGLGLIIVCYNIKSIGFFRFLSKFGYALSIGLLLVLALHVDIGGIKAAKINEAWRAIKIGGFQLHVFEVVKVAMIMYLSWAVNEYKNGRLETPALIMLVTKGKPLSSLWQKIIFIYFPIFSVCVGIMVGSLSSTIFIGGIMFLTILVGGIGVKELVLPGAAAVGVLLLCIAINKINPEKPLFPHLDSALNRHELSTENYLEKMKANPRGSQEYQKALDKIKQPMSAKIAIHEGGLIGKGPGRSTQRYVVPVMFEDYMFSFIIEEYGLLGGGLVVILYISLLARGALIVRNCDNLFAKTAVAGLVMLITGQAMMHCFINCDIGPLTGQTLPMVSHGNSSFLMFSVAFGIILSISKMAKKKIDREVAQVQPLGESSSDSLRDDLDDLERLESVDDIINDNLERKKSRGNEL